MLNKGIIVFVCGLLCFVMTGCENETNNLQGKKVEKQEQVQQSKIAQVDKIEVIDFHGNRRCFSCQTIEKYAQETLVEFFSAELADGKITFDSINVEEAQNMAIVQKYQARGSSLFINTIRNGEDHIEEEVQVWRLVQDEEAYKDYFRGKIDRLLN